MAGRRIDFQAVMNIADVRQKIGQIEQRLGTTGEKMSQVGGVAKTAFGVVATGGIATAGVALFNHGMEVQALEGRYKTVFAGVTREFDRWIDDQNEKFGVSEGTLKGMAASIGDLLVPLGMTREEAAKTTQEVLETANALSEWSGGKYTAAEASEILTKAVLGEFDSLKQLGVDLDAAEVKTKAVEIAGGELTGQAGKQAEAMATLALITDKSADALSKYEAGGDRAVRTAKELQARVGDLKDSFGEAALAATPLITAMLDIAPKGVISGSTAEVTDLIAALLDAGVTLDGFQEKWEELQASDDPAARQAAIDGLYALADGTKFYRDEVNRLVATGGYGKWVEDQVPVAETAAGKLNAILYGIGGDAVAKFGDMTDGIIDTWEGLPDDFGSSKFDIDQAIQNTLDMAAAEQKFKTDMETLTGAGLTSVVKALSDNPNREAAMTQAAALAADLGKATDLEQAMTDAVGLAAARLEEEYMKLRTDEGVNRIAIDAGAQHARSYKEGWNSEMAGWTPTTPTIPSWTYDQIERGLHNRGLVG